MNYSLSPLLKELSQSIELLKKHPFLASLAFLATFHFGFLIDEKIWGRGFFAYPLQGALPLFMLLLSVVLSWFFLRNKRKLVIEKKDILPWVFLCVMLCFSSVMLDYLLLLLCGLLYLAWLFLDSQEKQKYRDVSILGFTFAICVHGFFSLKQIFFPGAFHLFIEPFLHQDISFLSQLKSLDLFRAYGLTTHPNYLAFVALQGWILADLLSFKKMRKFIKLLSGGLLFLTFSQIFILSLAIYELWRAFSWKKCTILSVLCMALFWIREFSWSSPSILERILNYKIAFATYKEAPLMWKQSFTFWGDYMMKPWDYQALHWNFGGMILEFSSFVALFILCVLLLLFKDSRTKGMGLLLGLFLFLPDPMIMNSWMIFFLFFVQYFMFLRKDSFNKEE